jgi:hypothetical protein
MNAEEVHLYRQLCLLEWSVNSANGAHYDWFELRVHSTFNAGWKLTIPMTFASRLFAD